MGLEWVTGMKAAGWKRQACQPLQSPEVESQVPCLSEQAFLEQQATFPYKATSHQTSTQTAVPFQNALLVTQVRFWTYLSDSYSSYCRGPHFTGSSSRSHWANFSTHNSCTRKSIRPGLGDIKLLVHK